MMSSRMDEDQYIQADMDGKAYYSTVVSPHVKRSPGNLTGEKPHRSTQATQMADLFMDNWVDIPISTQLMTLTRIRSYWE